MKLQNIVLETDAKTVPTMKGFQIVFVFDVGDGKTWNCPLWFTEHSNVFRIVQQLTHATLELVGKVEG
jgi:hypothetical protein